MITIREVDPYVGQNYYTTPTSQRQEITVENSNQGVTKQWKFQYTHVLKIKNPTKPIESMDLTSPTYIKTSAKINNLSGHTLIISNSHNIGDIRASTVVLLNSTVKSIVADDILMFYSLVKGDVDIKNKLVMVLAPSLLGVESSTSYTSMDKSTVNFRLNDQGTLDVVVQAGTISNPEFTVNGQPQQGKVILEGSGKLKSESKSESDD